MLIREELALEFAPPAGGIRPDEWTLPNVKLLGRKSGNQREYPPAVQQAALPLFDEAIVYLDHFDTQDKYRKPTDNRPYSERLGTVANPKFDAQGECTRGDIRLNPAHPLAPAVKHDFIHGTKKLGMSIVADVRYKDQAKSEVAMVNRLYSVDVVNNPGSLATLSESLDLAEQRDVAGVQARVDGHDARLTTMEAAHAELSAKFADKFPAEPEELKDNARESQLLKLRSQLDSLVTEVKKLDVKPSSPHVPNPFDNPLTKSAHGAVSPALSSLLQQPFSNK